MKRLTNDELAQVTRKPCRIRPSQLFLNCAREMQNSENRIERQKDAMEEAESHLKITHCVVGLTPNAKET